MLIKRQKIHVVKPITVHFQISEILHDTGDTQVMKSYTDHHQPLQHEGKYNIEHM